MLSYSDDFRVTNELLDPNDPMTILADIFLNEEANMLAKIRRRRDGIVDECCKLKGCSYSELSTYCKGGRE